MEVQNTDESKIKKTGIKKSEKEVIRVEFNLKLDEDKKILNHLNSLLATLNSDSTLRQVKDSELVKRAILGLDERDLTKVRDSLMSKGERIKLWTKNYNMKNQTDLSVEDFMVDVLPGLTKKELKIYQRVTVQ